MITIDYFISFGYGRKRYNELKKDYIKAHSWGNDYIFRAVQYFNEKGEDPQEVRERFLTENHAIKDESDEYARGVLELMVDSLNRQGYNENQVRNEYNKDT